MQATAKARGMTTRCIRRLSAAAVSCKSRQARPKSTTVTAMQPGTYQGQSTRLCAAAAVKDAGGPELDRRRIEVPTPIRTVGSHTALVRLHPEVQATVELDVVAG